MVEALELRGVTKRFGSLLANDNITLSLGKGEVLALLGENGAGKTTLMNIVFGHYVADSGDVKVHGKRLPPGSPDAAIRAGIGMVHQHFTLADNLSVLDNIVLGRESLWSPRQRLRAAKCRVREISGQYGLELDPDARVGDLAVGQKQKAEILKALYADARILILDEPTAVLTPQEAESLFATLRSLAQKGFSAIIISHKLHEILRVSDRISVLRNGQLVGDIAAGDANRDRLAEMMLGRKVSRPSTEHLETGKPVLELESVSTDGEDQAACLNGIDLTVCAHEIAGIAGVAGNGQTALAGVISGTVVPSLGKILLAGSELEFGHARRVVKAGVGRIPEDRSVEGIFGEMAIWENLISEDLRSGEFCRAGILLNGRNARRHAASLIEQYDIRCRGVEAETRLLSGGNLQKLILARGLSRNPRFILVNQPSRGLDEGAIAFVHSQLLDARKAGAGILLISEDLDELLSLADRLYVIYRGRIQAVAPTKSPDVTQIGLMMSGEGMV